MYKKDWTFWECVELSTVWTQLHAAYAGSHDGSASSSYCLQWLVVDNEVISVRCTSDYVCGSFLLLYCSFLSVDHHVVVWMLEFVLSLYAHGWPLEPHFWNLNCMNPLCSMLQSHVFMINSQSWYYPMFSIHSPYYIKLLQTPHDVHPASSSGSNHRPWTPQWSWSRRPRRSHPCAPRGAGIGQRCLESRATRATGSDGGARAVFFRLDMI